MYAIRSYYAFLRSFMPSPSRFLVEDSDDRLGIAEARLELAVGEDQGRGRGDPQLGGEADGLIDGRRFAGEGRDRFTGKAVLEHRERLAADDALRLGIGIGMHLA